MKCNRLTSDVSNAVRKKEGKVNGNCPLGGRERERGRGRERESVKLSSTTYSGPRPGSGWDGV